MKKINICAAALVMAGMMIPSIAGAQEIEYGDDTNTIKVDKKVTKTEKDLYGEAHDEYLITLETFVTGSQTTTEVRKPVDISLILDVSGSMGYELKNTSDYYLNRVGSISYSETISAYSKVKDFDNGYKTFEWDGTEPDCHPYYYSLSGTSQNSEFVYKDGDKYCQIFRGDTGDNNYFSSKGYYIYIETDTIIEDPITENNIKQRRFLGKDSSGNYVASDPAPASLPVVKDGDSYIPWDGFYATDEKTILYAGDLYTKSRMDALKNAVKSFINIIADDDKNLAEGQHHQIGIIKFSNEKTNKTGNDLISTGNHNNYTQTLVELQPITNSEAIKNELDGLTASGITRTDYAMELAESMLKDSDASRTRIAILFTDGEPTSNSNFDYDVANNALKVADNLKRQGVIVYVIGLTSTDLSKRFMEYTSSDYEAYPDPAANTKMVKGSTDKDASNDIHGNQVDYKYFNLVENGEQLQKIFESIADQTAKTRIGYNLSKDNTVVLDALSKNFLLPEGTDEKNIGLIHVYTSDFLGNDTFAEKGAETGWKEITGSEGLNVNVNGREVSVNGFDFAANWVGYNEISKIGVEPTKEAHGKKLVIEIPIVVDPRNPGGAEVYSNEAFSGIYNKEGEHAPDTKKPLVAYPQPTLTMPNIIIEKSGMVQGDCAMFKIVRVDEKGGEMDGYKAYTIMLTANADGKAQSQIKLNTSGRYKITEESWSWAYIPSDPSSIQYQKDDASKKTQAGIEDGTGIPFVIRNVNSATEESVYVLGSTTKKIKGTLFKFENTVDTNAPMHDEASINNVFGKFEYEAPADPEIGKNK